MSEEADGLEPVKHGHVRKAPATGKGSQGAGRHHEKQYQYHQYTSQQLVHFLTFLGSTKQFDTSNISSSPCTMVLCQLCASISLTKMRGPGRDQIQPHQPTYLALKRSAGAGCELCKFFWVALEQGTDKERLKGTNRAALSHVCERYPGRQISLVAWGGSNDTLDRIHIITTGDIPEVEDDDEDDAPADPTMHPDYQFALDGVVDLYAEHGNERFSPNAF